MRVVMLVHNMVGRGTFQRAHSLARHLATNGNQVTIYAGAVAPAAPRDETLNGVRVVSSYDPLSDRARESGLSPFELVSRIRHGLSEPCDIVHCFDHRPTVSITGLIMARRHRVPLIFDWADLWGFDGIASHRGIASRIVFGTTDELLENRVRRYADGLTVISTALRARAQSYFDIPIHLLPVGASSDLIRPLPKDEMRRKFRLPEDAFIAMHTGLAPYDMRYLAESFVILAQRQPRSILVMTARRFPEIEQILASAGLSDRLICLGMLDLTGLGEALACADALLLPYTNCSVNRYRYPNKLGDYLSAGRPIVTNRTGDLGSLVEREGVGLVADDTPEAFAASIEKLATDIHLATELAHRARQFAEQKLDWRFLAADLERFYHDILDRHSK